MVRDLMTVGVPTCAADAPLIDIARFMLEKNLDTLTVLDQEGHAIGVISQDELVRHYSLGDLENLTAEDAMTEGVPQVPPDIPLTAAAAMMLDMGVRAAYLMHNSGGIIYPAAMISYRHILRHIAAQSEDELRDLGISAERRSPIDVFIEKRDAARREAESHHEE
jgi:CBS domain-containing protein